MIDKIPSMKGTKIITMSGQKYELTSVVGYGSQGIVYNESSGKLLVKLYYPSGSRDVDISILERLLYIKNIKMPRNFITILDIIEKPYIGYIMEKALGYKPLNSYLFPPVNRDFFEWYNAGLGLRERLFIGYIIAKAFGELESNNLSYCDISGNNIMVRISKNASVKMIDIDNIYIAGRGKASILGTPRYIAPEIINKQKNPDVLSDNYALAVILFELLRVGHPYISDDVLDGTAEDEEDALTGKLDYVTEENSTNMLPEDLVFTDQLKKLFKKCFVDGKKNRIKRPSAVEFQYAMLDASNKLVKCPKCGKWYYARKSYKQCPWECGSAVVHPTKLNFYDVLYDGVDYRNSNVVCHKLVSSYCLRAGKNQIKSLYILRYDDISTESRAAENYVTIAKDNSGYYVYNEFFKEGIYVRDSYDGKLKKVFDKRAILLKQGDEIYFEIHEKEPICIECGGKKYSFIKMARFVEGKP